MTIEKGVLVRVNGFLQSRDYEERLADFLKGAYGDLLSLPETLDPANLCAPHGTSEVIARRIMGQKNGKKRNDP